MQIPIILVSSDEFLDYCLVTCRSVIECASEDDRYTFYIVHNDIPPSRREWFSQVMSEFESCSVNFLYAGASEYVSTPSVWDDRRSCMLFYAVYALNRTDKAIAIDVDTIVRKDIALLYGEDLGDNLLGAVYDLDFIGQWQRGNKNYRKEYGKLIPPLEPDSYTQAGVLLLNLRMLREHFPNGRLIEEACSKKYLYDDQDIWNYFCAGKIHFLDLRWNVLHDNNGYRMRYVLPFAPEHLYNEYLNSRKDPFIIHYAGAQKPWNDIRCDYSDAYWAVANRTSIAAYLRSGLNGTKTRRSKNPCYRALRFLYHEAIRCVDLIRLKLFSSKIMRSKNDLGLKAALKSKLD